MEIQAATKSSKKSNKAINCSNPLCLKEIDYSNINMFAFIVLSYFVMSVKLLMTTIWIYVNNYRFKSSSKKKYCIIDRPILKHIFIIFIIY
jgi:hypothetical protein